MRFCLRLLAALCFASFASNAFAFGVVTITYRASSGSTVVYAITDYEFGVFQGTITTNNQITGALALDLRDDSMLYRIGTDVGTATIIRTAGVTVFTSRSVGPIAGQLT